MKCAEARDRLLEVRPGAASGEVATHLAGCAACAAFAARLALAQEAMRAHHAGVEPGPGFASRVAAELPGPSEMLGWAALRLLPAGLALAAALAAWSLVAAPDASSLFDTSPSDDPLAWVMASEENGP